MRNGLANHGTSLPLRLHRLERLYRAYYMERELSLKGITIEDLSSWMSLDVRKLQQNNFERRTEHEYNTDGGPVQKTLFYGKRS